MVGAGWSIAIGILRWRPLSATVMSQYLQLKTPIEACGSFPSPQGAVDGVWGCASLKLNRVKTGGSH